MARAEAVRVAADDLRREALEIAEWDATFVPAKLDRALVGRDRHEQGEDFDDDPVQNVEKTFPNAPSFIRPGFDEPDR